MNDPRQFRRPSPPRLAWARPSRAAPPSTSPGTSQESPSSTCSCPRAVSCLSPCQPRPSFAPATAAQPSRPARRPPGRGVRLRPRRPTSSPSFLASCVPTESRAASVRRPRSSGTACRWSTGPRPPRGAGCTGPRRSRICSRGSGARGKEPLGRSIDIWRRSWLLEPVSDSFCRRLT